MAEEVIRTFESEQELDDFIRSGIVGTPSEEEPFRDENGQRLTPELVLELAREIERETGRKLIFRRG